MNGQLKRLLTVCWLVGGLGACDSLESVAPISAEAENVDVVEAASEPVPVPSEESYVDISGCWKEVQLKDSRVPTSSNFNIYKIAPNEFTFHKPPQRTKYVVKESLTFQEVNYDDAKPFLPVGTIASAGNIADNGDTINRFVSGQPNPHVYRRCQHVFDQPVEEAEPQPPIDEAIGQPEPTESTLAPLIPGASTPAESAEPALPDTDISEPPLPVVPSSSPTPDAS